MKKSVLLVLAFLLQASLGLILAQSTDKRHPTPLTSSVLEGRLGGRDAEYHYSFTAGPGEVTITVEVSSEGHSTGLTFDLQANNTNHILIPSTRAQSDGGSARKTASVNLTARQTVVLHITQSSLNGAGSYRMRIGGAVVAVGERSQAASKSTGMDQPSGVSTTQSLQLSPNAGRFNGRGKATTIPRLDLPALQNMLKNRRPRPSPLRSAVKQQLYEGKVPTHYATLTPGQMTVPDKAILMTLYNNFANYQDVTGSSFIDFGGQSLPVPPTLYISINNSKASASYLIDVSVMDACYVNADCKTAQYTVGQGGSEQTVIANENHLLIRVDQADVGWHSFYIRKMAWVFYSCEITRLD